MTLTSKALRFRSKYITSELAQLFSQSDSEEEFQGFSEDEDLKCYNKRIKSLDSEEDSDIEFYFDGDEPSSPKRNSLLVALRFPMKRLSTPNQALNKKEQTATKNKEQDKVIRPPQHRRQKVKPRNPEEEEEKGADDDDLSLSLKKRDKNIQENKAMLAKLFADLSTMAVLTPPSTPQKKKNTQRKRKFEADTGSERRNPSRKARPPENFAVEEKTAPALPKSPRTVNIRALVEVSGDKIAKGDPKRKANRRSHYLVKSVDEITEEDLDNIAYRSKDKIWDKENGSSCHQCRQKTLDTKTVCRSGFCSGGKGQFCGPCLKNRYGEDVRTVLLDPTWSCPICRGMCNCSLCRKKEGRCATGILVGLARYSGHDNVHEYLERIQKELK